MSRMLTRRLTHLAAVRTADGAGGFLESWVVQGAIWCEVRMRSGDLKQTEFGERPRLKVRILTRAVPPDHPARPRPGDHLQEGSRIYLVEAVHESDVQGHYLAILASELPAEEAGV